MKASRLRLLFVSLLVLALTACAPIAVTRGALRAMQPDLAAPTGSPGSAEQAVQQAIERGNHEQEQAIASSDSSVMTDTSTDAYYRGMAQTNQAMLDGGVTAIRLVKIEWGPVTVNGGTATATTYETWSTDFSDGTTEQARDRNVYTLAQQDGVWKIQADDHPDQGFTTTPGRSGPGSAAPAPGSTPPSDAPAPAISPRGQNRSANWAGYIASGGGFTSVAGTWTVPQATASTGTGSDASWVGIGGESTRDLIQAGTEETILGPGRVQYNAWIEMLPQASRPVPLTVHPGDSITVSISQQDPDLWGISFTNNTTGGTYERTVRYSSSLSSAEWVEEAPSGLSGGVLPLSDFGSVTFSEAYAVRQGQQISLSEAHAQPMTMINRAGQAIATPSVVSTDGAGFTVTRTANSSTDSGRGSSRSPRRGRFEI